MSNADLMAAITSGIAEASPTAESQNDDSDSGEETGAEIESTEGAEDTGSDDGADSEGADGSGDEGEDSEASGEAGAEEVDADGNKLEGKGTAEGKDGADGKAAAKDGKANQPATKDPVNDPLPNALKKETRERMTSLISAVKTTKAEIERVSAERDEVLNLILDTKTTPEQYGDTLNYLKLVNSGDPVQMGKALEIMQKEVEVLAQALGRAVPGVDVLAAHPDLKQAVELGQISEEYANEIVQQRNTTRLTTAVQTQQRTATQANEAQSAAFLQGRNALNTLETQLKASDPQYAQKAAILIDALKPVISAAHPSQWANIWKTAYDKLKLPTIAPRTNKGVPTNQPLRAKTPSGSAAKAPSSALEAMNQALGH